MRLFCQMKSKGIKKHEYLFVQGSINNKMNKTYKNVYATRVVDK